MKAVCNFTTVPKMNLQGGSFRVPACFLPILGKPFVQHVIEYIERLGIDTVSIYVSQYADELERFIGDGERWGLKVSYHLVKQQGPVSSRIRNSNFIDSGGGDVGGGGGDGEGEQFLMCNALHLPLISREQLDVSCRFLAANGNNGDNEADGKSGDAGDSGNGTGNGNGELETGWSWGTLDELLENRYSRNITVADYSLKGPADYIKSLRQSLVTDGSGLIFFGNHIREGIWTGPGSRISPSATINPPVYIDSQVSVGDGAIIGPYAELGRGSVVDTDSFVTESSILPGSYIGKNLDVRRCIVNQNQVLNADLLSVYSSADDFLLSPVDSREGVKQKVSVSPGSRFLALFLGLITLPLLAVLFVIGIAGKKKPSRKITVVPIPQQREAGDFGSVKTRRMRQLRSRSDASSRLASHLLWQLIPGVWGVAAGRMRFIGIPLKTREEFDRISKDWQGLYLRSNPGLISEADIIYSEYPTDEILFATEMYYSVNDSRRYNLQLLRRYVKALFSGREA
jgi:NDP-sugar pyrophosphorylase family protein